MKENPGLFFLNLGLLALLGSCIASPKSTRFATHTPPLADAGLSSQAPEPIHTQSANQIIFLTLAIGQDSSRTNRVIRVENMTKKPGLLKAHRPMPDTPGPHLRCILLSGTQPLDTFLLEHPLFKNQEYVNELNQLVWKALSLDQASFFIRFQQKGASHLILEERLPGSQVKELVRIKL